MTQSILTLEYGNQQIRVYLDDKRNPWWVAKDVCAALGLKDYQHYCDKIDDGEKSRQLIPSAGKRRTMITMNKAGLNKLLSEADETMANDFRKWIDTVALPKIRKEKSTPNKVRITLNDTYDGQALRAIKRQEDEIRRLYEWSGLKQLEEIRRMMQSPVMNALDQIGAVSELIPESPSDQIESIASLPEYDSLRDTIREAMANETTLEEVNRVLSIVQSPVIETAQRFWEAMGSFSTEELVRSTYEKVQDFIKANPLQVASEIQKTLQLLDNFARDFSLESEDIIFNPDNTITISDNAVAFDEVRVIGKETVGSNRLVTEKGFCEGIQTLLDEIKNERANGTRQTVLICVLGIFLQFILQPLFQPHIDNFYKNMFSPQKEEITKPVEGPRQLNNIRYVSTDLLEMRRDNNRRSQLIQKLKLGDRVIVIRESEEWSLVEWRNGESVLRGWVFTRYLERFK